MSHVPTILNTLARLLRYPDESTVQTAEYLYVVLRGELDDAANNAAEFGSYAEEHDLGELEEVFTQTFDINPVSALEVGWHLFGEEYARGMFLVRMREELRKYSLPESEELPDHLSHVLAIVSAMPTADATRFVRACVQPAVQKMREALLTKDTPYRHVISCLADVLEYVWGAPSEIHDGQPQADGNHHAFKRDPLHAFPVADVDCGCCDTGCQSGVTFVPLQTDVLATTPQTPEAISIRTRKP